MRLRFRPIIPRPSLVTTILILINAIAYVITADSNGYLTWIDLPMAEAFGYKVGSPIQNVFSMMFLHANLLHLGMNMFALYLLGNFAEKHLGVTKYLALYFASGISAVFLSVTITPYDGKIMLGASGAIFGLVGIASALGDKEATNLLYLQFGLWGMSELMKVIDILPVISIGYAAHIGGFVYGFLITKYVLMKKNPILKDIPVLPLSGLVRKNTQLGFSK